MKTLLTSAKVIINSVLEVLKRVYRNTNHISLQVRIHELLRQVTVFGVAWILFEHPKTISDQGWLARVGGIGKRDFPLEEAITSRRRTDLVGSSNCTSQSRSVPGPVMTCSQITAAADCLYIIRHLRESAARRKEGRRRRTWCDVNRPRQTLWKKKIWLLILNNFYFA